MKCLPSGAFLRVLGERLNGIQEARGSIPLISTMKSVIVLIADFFMSTSN